jgi:hypothetical protein
MHHHWMSLAQVGTASDQSFVNENSEIYRPHAVCVYDCSGSGITKPEPAAPVQHARHPEFWHFTQAAIIEILSCRGERLYLKALC